MTGRAADALVDVYRVIEIDEVRQIMYLDPFDGLAAAKTLADDFKVRAVRPDLRMAIHAGLGRRDAGGGRYFDRGVAITAIDAVVAGVMFMAELHGLFARHESLRVVPGARPGIHKPKDSADEKDGPDGAHL